MNAIKIAALALVANVAVAAPAFALSDATVNHSDIAAVSSQVRQIADAQVRADAERKVLEATSYVNDNNDYQAYRALIAAQKLADSTEVAERAN